MLWITRALPVHSQSGTVRIRNHHASRRRAGTLLPQPPPLPFGSTRSVWSYLRVADVLSFLAVSLLIVPSAHFVDDFYQSEDSEMAQSVFSAFKTFHINLGFRMKEPKEKRPTYYQVPGRTACSAFCGLWLWFQRVCGRVPAQSALPNWSPLCLSACRRALVRAPWQPVW